jgi:hypothetical protein
MTETQTATRLLIEYAYAVGTSLAHVVICRKCGDTDYECDKGRALRLVAAALAPTVGRDDCDDTVAVVAALDAKAAKGRTNLSRPIIVSTAWEVIGA